KAKMDRLLEEKMLQDIKKELVRKNVSDQYIYNYIYPLVTYRGVMMSLKPEEQIDMNKAMENRLPEFEEYLKQKPFLKSLMKTETEELFKAIWISYELFKFKNIQEREKYIIPMLDKILLYHDHEVKDWQEYAEQRGYKPGKTGGWYSIFGQDNLNDDGSPDLEPGNYIGKRKRGCNGKYYIALKDNKGTYWIRQTLLTKHFAQGKKPTVKTSTKSAKKSVKSAKKSVNKKKASKKK
ncbi:unnamed protein product, partial [marine sediment metagenome]